MALGRELALVMTPGQASGDDETIQAMQFANMHKINAEFAAALSGGPLPEGTLPDFGQLKLSITSGVAKIAPRLPDALGGVYAQDFDVDTLRAAVAFYGSAAERDVIARRAALLNRLETFEEALLAKLSSAQSDELLRQTEETYAITPAEKTFGETHAGQALAARAKETDKEITSAIQKLWPEAVTSAERDYCGKRTCRDEEERVLFRHLAELFEPEAD